jgi:hypothetical protein
MRNALLERIEQKIADYGRVICHMPSQMNQINNPIPPEWENYVTQSPVALEVIQDTLYDSLVFTSATTTSLTFFVESIATTNLGITNMQQPGMLPNPESFLVQAIRFYVRWTTQTAAATVAASPINDLMLLVNTGILTAKFGNKTYGPWPLWMMGAGNFVQSSIGSTIATSLAVTAPEMGGPLWALFPALMISPLQSFQASITWPAGTVTLGAGNPTIQLVYEGQRARAVN